MNPSPIFLESLVPDWLYYFWLQHPIVCFVLLLFVFRWIARWFFGIGKLRHAQNRHNELLEQQSSMLERQSQMLQKHEGVISRLGEKYL